MTLNEREAFEDWADAKCYYLDKRDDGGYEKGSTALAWEIAQYFMEVGRKQGVEKAKAQAVPEGRTDVEIIKQTIGLVDLIAKANRFERNKTAALPFESQNPRVKEWWDLACEIQDLLTQTDPNNCDFEEYKDLIASESGAEG